MRKSRFSEEQVIRFFGSRRRGRRSSRSASEPPPRTAIRSVRRRSWRGSCCRQRTAGSSAMPSRPSRDQSGSPRSSEIRKRRCSAGGLLPRDFRLALLPKGLPDLAGALRYPICVPGFSARARLRSMADNTKRPRREGLTVATTTSCSRCCRCLMPVIGPTKSAWTSMGVGPASLAICS
jgi:hypothetical protein